MTKDMVICTNIKPIPLLKDKFAYINYYSYLCTLIKNPYKMKNRKISYNAEWFIKATFVTLIFILAVMGVWKG